MRKLAVVAFAVAALSASGAYAQSMYVSRDLEAAKAMSPTGDAFSRALHAEYTREAEIEFKRPDMLHARRWVNKALAAGRGEEVLPEPPRAWWVPQRAEKELDDGHAALMTELNGNARTRNPAAAARAQAMFDCWLEEEHEDIWYRAPGLERVPGGGQYQPEDVARCKDGFMAAMAELKGAPAGQYIVYFAFDRANLTAAANQELAKVANAAKASPNARVSVYGHADRSGSDTYNLNLSKRRAAAVVNALTRQGVAANRITSAGFGESRPAVETRDGVPEQRNRRSEITVQ